MSSILRAIYEFVLDFVETIAVSLAIFFVLYIFAFQPHQVKGESMEPNFHDGEYLLTNKLTYRFDEPQCGDVIIFKAPSNEEFDYIKRIVGCPGDRVKLLNGKIYINGQELDESIYLDDAVQTTQERFLREGMEIVVEPQAFFVAGDNRPRSSDSRDFGTVPRENIVGKAWLRYWPPDSVGIVEDVKATTKN